MCKIRIACNRERPCKRCVEKGIQICSYHEQDDLVVRSYTQDKNRWFTNGKDIDEDEHECIRYKADGQTCSGETPCEYCIQVYRKHGQLTNCTYRKKGKWVERYSVKPFDKPSGDSAVPRLINDDEMGKSEHYLEEQADPNRKEFNDAFPNGYEVIETPSYFDKCGMYAVRGSMSFQHNIEVEIIDLDKHWENVKRDAVNFDCENDENFSLDQLQAILSSWCRYKPYKFQIACITDRGQILKYPINLKQNEKATTVWIHNNMNKEAARDTEAAKRDESATTNHFSAIKQRCHRPNPKQRKRKKLDYLSSDSEMGDGAKDTDVEPTAKKTALTVRRKINVLQDPRNRREVMEATDSEQWRKAKEAEFEALEAMGTLTIVERTPDMYTIPSKLVYRRKIDEAGNIKKHKARLVARGDRKKGGIDFEETYSSVAKASSFRILVALSARFGWRIQQSDVKTAYLNGKLDTTIYMNPPKGFDLPKGQTWKLNRALYGLKQSPRLWYETLTEKLRAWNWVPSQYDSCVWISQDKDIIILFWVDDILTFSANRQKVDMFLKRLSQSFEISDDGEVKYCLGINVERTNTYIKLHSDTYIQQALRRYNLENIFVAKTPSDPNVKLTHNPGTATSKFREEFQSKLSTLAYPSNYTRPDITFATNYAARYGQNPSQEHMDAVDRIYAYLKGISKNVITYNTNDAPEFKLYSDSDHAGCQDTRRSTTSWVMTFMGGPVNGDPTDKIRWHWQRVTLNTLQQLKQPKKGYGPKDL